MSRKSNSLYSATSSPCNQLAIMSRCTDRALVTILKRQACKLLCISMLRFNTCEKHKLADGCMFVLSHLQIAATSQDKHLLIAACLCQGSSLLSLAHGPALSRAQTLNASGTHASFRGQSLQVAEVVCRLHTANTCRLLHVCAKVPQLSGCLQVYSPLLPPTVVLKDNVKTRKKGAERVYRLPTCTQSFGLTC